MNAMGLINVYVRPLSSPYFSRVRRNGKALCDKYPQLQDINPKHGEYWG